MDKLFSTYYTLRHAQQLAGKPAAAMCNSLLAKRRSFSVESTEPQLYRCWQRPWRQNSLLSCTFFSTAISITASCEKVWSVKLCELCDVDTSAATASSRGKPNSGTDSAS